MPPKLPKYDTVNNPPKSGDTLVIVPVYNEMPHLANVIRTIRTCWSGDILAVDDNSSDGSLDALEMFASVGCIHNRGNAGAGGVLLQAFRVAAERGYESVITLDADGQHSPVLIKDFFAAIQPHCNRSCRCRRKSDFVWGSRYMEGHRKLAKPFRNRQEVNKIITRRLNEVTGYRLTDAFCGFRAYRLSALAKLDLTETGYGMFMQMTVQAARAGITIKELPVPLVYLDDTRNFQGEFDNTSERLAYYHSVIGEELARGS